LLKESLRKTEKKKAPQNQKHGVLKAQKRKRLLAVGKVHVKSLGCQKVLHQGGEGTSIGYGNVFLS